MVFGFGGWEGLPLPRFLFLGGLTWLRGCLGMVDSYVLRGAPPARAPKNPFCLVVSGCPRTLPSRRIFRALALVRRLAGLDLALRLAMGGS